MKEGDMFSDNKILSVKVESEVQKSFLEYSMSVIVSRALPDVRDGLKPIHRRILYALNDQGMTHDKPHKKSANIVGEVMGKYHPHGDSSIYGAMVRLAQDFSMRYPLVDGHGNFGSIDGDSPAAMRYTESRMSKIADEMLKDIEKETVDWMPNYDDTRVEPTVLPSRLPNILLNGSEGIAVGMATKMPPHNLKEVCNAVKATLDNPEITVSDLMKIIPGPDFPTRAQMMKNGIREAYETGKGTIKVRAKYHLEEKKGGKTSIVYTEIPYMVNKSRLIERIADLVKDKKVEGISDLRDESDRNGIRIVIELKREANVDLIINRLYKNTQLQDSFGIINLVLYKNRPKIMSLKEILNCYIEHRREIITRRTQYELKLARDREHILEGLKIAIDNIDDIVEIIRGSKNREDARNSLISKYGLSEIQANAILDMRLVQLTNLERNKIEEDLKQIRDKIADLLDILTNSYRVTEIIREDMDEIIKKYGDERRTEIIGDIDDPDETSFIPDDGTVITISDRGYVKRQPLDTYKAQRRGGKGTSAAKNRSEDYTSNVIVTTLLSNILFFTDQGRAFVLKAHQIPEFSRQAKGQAIINLIALRNDEKVTTAMPVSTFDTEDTIAMVTYRGFIKRVKLNAFKNIRKQGINAINLSDDDHLIGVIRGNDDVNEDELVMIVTAHGQAIVFNVEEVRVMGRTAMGVKAINLGFEDYVIGVDKVDRESEVIIVTQNGYGKRTLIEEFESVDQDGNRKIAQHRGGKGKKTITITRKNGPVVGFKIVKPDEDLMIITCNGMIIRIHIQEISVKKRGAQGIKLITPNQADYVTAVETFKYDEDETVDDENE